MARTIDIMNISANQFGNMVRSGDFVPGEDIAINTARGGKSILRYLNGDIRRELESNGSLIYNIDLAPSEELFNEFDSKVKALMSLKDKISASEKRNIHNNVFKDVDYKNRYLAQFIKNPIIEVEESVKRVFLICNCGVGFKCHNELLKSILSVKTKSTGFDWDSPGYEVPSFDEEQSEQIRADRLLKREYDRLWIADKRRGE